MRFKKSSKKKEKKTNKNGEETWSKSKNEQLQDPPSMTSPTQLAIFFYDVLDVGVTDNFDSLIIKSLNKLTLSGVKNFILKEMKI